MGKYTVEYNRKVRVASYEMLTIGLVQEFDDSIDKDYAFDEVRDQVDKWIEQERDRLLKTSVKRPEGS